MLANFFTRNRRSKPQRFAAWMLAMAVSLTLLLVVPAGSGQSQGQTQTPPQTDDNGKPKQDVTPEAGGPGGDIGPYTIPKKTTEEAPPPPPPPTPKNVEGMPDYSIHVNCAPGECGRAGHHQEGEFVPGLKKDNFRLFEDGARRLSTPSMFRRHPSPPCCWWNMQPLIMAS